MADGSMTLNLDDALLARLQAAADEEGLSAQAYAVRLLESSLAEGWDETRRRLADFERHGVSLDAAEVLAQFRAAVSARPVGEA